MRFRDGDLAGLAVAILVLTAVGAPGAAPGDEGAEPGARTIHLRLQSGHAEGPEAAELRVVRVPEDSDGGEVLVRTVELANGSAEVEVSLPEGGPFRISTTAPASWSRPILVDEGSSPDATAILWPAAELEAELDLPDRRDRPEEVGIRLSPVPRLADAAAASQPEQPVELLCPVTETSALSCSVPAGRWNLRLTAAPFAPELFWDVRVEVVDGLGLGTVRLRRGGSVLGRLTTEQGPVDPRRARVELRPLRASDSDDPALEEELRQLDRVAEVGEDGSFQLVGVAPGLYEVRASHPGFVPETRAPVTVEAGTVTELAEPLVLESPLRLSLFVEPATEPSGRPWTLELYRQPGPRRMKLAAEGETDAAGFWDSPPLPAGSYRVRLLDAKDETLVEREVELDRASQVTRIEVPLVYVEGEVRLGDDPLEAEVWFGGRTGNVRVKAESDETGELFAVLPRDGEWRVDVQAGSPAVRSRGLHVDVPPMEGGEPAEVEIEVPATTVSGRVIDELGRAPREPARVVLLRPDGETGPTSIETDPAGEFEIGGVPPGSYRIAAETREARSKPVVLQVSEDLTTALTLVLEPEGRMVGRVVSEEGPVPGASVHVVFLTGTGQPARMRIPDDRTTPTGRFEVPRPAGAIAARVVVMAPGYALGVARVAPSEPAEIVLDRLAGRLHLQGVEGSIYLQEEGSTVGGLMLDGELLGLGRVLEWARTVGGGLTEDGTLAVPSMPPGRYALCRLTLQEAWLVLDGAALPRAGACAEAFLPPGGEVTLALPP